MGPTACGKTRIAVELAQQYPVEIISVDSALVYRGLDIGSGKPDLATQALAPHRLIDIRDPASPYSAAEFRQDAIAAMQEIVTNGRIPLLVGGTMLYFKALRDGLASLPAASPDIRRQIEALAAAEGWAAVHARLVAVDPVAGARIHPTDPQRLQRALEVYEMTGIPLSEHHARQDPGQARDLPCELMFMGMVPKDRARLHMLIEARFRTMLEQGLVDEVKVLWERSDLHSGLPAIRSVGYRQVWDYLDGTDSYTGMVDKAIAATRQLAKRQLTWMRSWTPMQELACDLQVNNGDEDGNIVKNALKLLSLNAIY